MKLLELIKYFRSGETFKDFCLKQSLNYESEVIEIYMQKPFNIDNELAFFEIEDTQGKIEFTFNNVKYYNLFDFYYFLDAIEEAPNSLTDDILKEKLFDYAVNDA